MSGAQTATRRQAVDVRFENISYEIPAPKRKFRPWTTSADPPTRILNQISGYVGAGQSLAILGPSGSGKTSLLNVLAARTQYQPTTGTVLFGGRPRVARTKRHIGYIMQDDVFFSKLTVRETLEFTANIRLSSEIGKAEKKRRVDEVIQRLLLTKCQHTRIGDQQFDKGISGGERKRVNIANELLHDPHLLLADECTSGLDSSSAYTVINLLKELCREGRTIICTIHQPSSRMFSMFNKILLLAAGRTAYYGPPSKVVQYFEAMDFPFPTSAFNPADYMLELVIDDRTSDTDPDMPSVQQRILEAWAQDGPQKVGEASLCGPSEHDFEVETQAGDHVAVAIESENTSNTCGTSDADDWNLDMSTEGSDAEHSSSPKPTAEMVADPVSPMTYVGRMVRATRKRFWDVSGQHGKDEAPDKYANGWFTQVYVLATRSLRQKRGALFESVYIAQMIAVTALTALAWFQTELRVGTILDRFGALSFICIFWSFATTYNALFTFPREKQVLNKDRAGGAYRLSAYYFAKSIVELPADMLYPTFYAIIVYFAIGLNPYFPSFILFNVVLILNVLCAQSMGLLISAIVMDVRKAQVVAAMYILSSMLLSGYYIDPDNFPSFVAPLRHISFIKYSYETLVRVELLDNRQFPCEGALGAYSNECDSDNDTVGAEAVLEKESLDNALPIPLGIVVLIGWIFAARILGYFALKLAHASHKPKRSSWRH